MSAIDSRDPFKKRSHDSTEAPQGKRHHWVDKRQESAQAAAQPAFLRIEEQASRKQAMRRTHCSMEKQPVDSTVSIPDFSSKTKRYRPFHAAPPQPPVLEPRAFRPISATERKGEDDEAELVEIFRRSVSIVPHDCDDRCTTPALGLEDDGRRTPRFDRSAVPVRKTREPSLEDVEEEATEEPQSKSTFRPVSLVPRPPSSHRRSTNSLLSDLRSSASAAAAAAFSMDESADLLDPTATSSFSARFAALDESDTLDESAGPAEAATTSSARSAAIDEHEDLEESADRFDPAERFLLPVSETPISLTRSVLGATPPASAGISTPMDESAGLFDIPEEV